MELVREDKELYIQETVVIILMKEESIKEDL